MQDYPSLSERGRRERHHHGDEAHQTQTLGASIWLAIVIAIIGFVVVLTISQGSVRNGGAPFLIIPSSQTTTTPGNGAG